MYLRCMLRTIRFYADDHGQAELRHMWGASSALVRRIASSTGPTVAPAIVDGSVTHFSLLARAPLRTQASGAAALLPAVPRANFHTASKVRTPRTITPNHHHLALLSSCTLRESKWRRRTGELLGRLQCGAVLAHEGLSRPDVSERPPPHPPPWSSVYAASLLRRTVPVFHQHASRRLHARRAALLHGDGRCAGQQQRRQPWRRALD